MKTKPFLFRALIFLLGCFFAGSQLQAQTFYALQIDRNTRFKAADITREYQPRLVMGADQALQFKLTVAKFLVKKRAVEADTSLSPGARFYHLKKLSSRETSEMAQILESYQLQEYMRIKPKIQPIPVPATGLRQNLIAGEETTIE